MTYSAAETEPLAQRLVSDLPGLDIRLARAWIIAESGDNGNVLGVTHVENGVSKLNTYATREQGIDAAAALVKSSSHYSGVRSAIAGGNVRQQALALIASPWNHPGSPYYTTRFTAAGLLGGLPTTSTSSGGPTLADALGRNVTLTNPAAIRAIAAELKAKGIGGTHTEGDIYTYLIDFIGKRASEVPLNYPGVVGADPKMNVDRSGESATIPGEGLIPAIPDVGSALIQVTTYLAALFIVGLGVFLYSKSNGGEKEVVVVPAS